MVFWFVVTRVSQSLYRCYSPDEAVQEAIWHAEALGEDTDIYVYDMNGQMTLAMTFVAGLWSDFV